MCVFFFLNKWLHNVKSPATCLVHRVSFLNHTMIHAFLSLLLCSPAPTLLGLGSGDRVWFFLCPVSLTLCVEPLYKNWVNKWWMEEWTDEQNLPNLLHIVENLKVQNTQPLLHWSPFERKAFLLFFSLSWLLFSMSVYKSPWSLKSLRKPRRNIWLYKMFLQKSSTFQSWVRSL